MHLKNLFGTIPLPKYICQLEISGYPLHGIIGTIGICPGKKPIATKWYMPLGYPAKKEKTRKEDFRLCLDAVHIKYFFVRQFVILNKKFT